MSTLNDAADLLNQAVQRATAPRSPFGEGFIAAIGTGVAAVRKGSLSNDPVPGFIVPPGVPAQVGDRVFYFEQGAYRLVIHNLTRAS